MKIRERVRTGASMKKFGWLNKKVEIRSSRISGKGAYAIKPIRKDEIIAVFGGRIFTGKELLKLPKNIFTYPIPIHKDFFIGPIYLKELDNTDYFNHSCDPNSGIKNAIFLVAMQNIEPKEEITFDYAMVGLRLIGNMKCNCKSKDCRKTITDNDYKSKPLRKRYKGYFSSFVQEKNDKLNS